MIFFGPVNRPRQRSVRVPRELRGEIKSAFVRVEPRTDRKTEDNKVLRTSLAIEGIIVRQKKAEGPNFEVVYPAQSEAVRKGYTRPEPGEIILREGGKSVTWRPKAKAKAAIREGKRAVAAHLERLKQTKEAELAAQRGGKERGR